MNILQTKKGINQRFNTLLVREVKAVQIAHLKREFELAELSRVAEAACALSAEAITAWEKEQGINRLRPGEMLLEKNDISIVLPFLNERALMQLKAGTSYRAVKRELEICQLEQLKRANPDAGLEDLWRLTNQAELVLKRTSGDFLPEKKLDPGKITPAGQERFNAQIPELALAPAIESLIDDWGLRPAQAEAMSLSAARLYAWCCPYFSSLNPGQIVWLVYGTKKSRNHDQRHFQPVVLTLWTPQDQVMPLLTTRDLKRLKTVQLERITREAWKQDGVLTALDLEWLLGISGATIRKILDAYREKFGIILPTAGTVLDMGRTLTHKTFVVDLALSGFNTQEIAARICHSPVAVDNYLRLFERVLLLKYYRFPVAVMPRVTGFSKGLLNEHLKLVDKHFPTEELQAEYLGQRGIQLEKISKGI